MTGWLKLKLMGLITFINAAIGVTLGGLLYTIWPDHYFKWYPFHSDLLLGDGNCDDLYT